jgi:glycosyl transferase, family 25
MSHRLEALVVSLTTSADRRALMEENLNSFPVPWKFLDALRVDGRCRFRPNKSRQLRRYGRPLTDSEIGCFKSHVLAMEEFERTASLDWLLVIEDDVWVDIDFNYPMLIEFIERMNLNYLRLYFRQWKPATLVANFGERQLIRFKTDPYGTQAYLVNRAGAKNFLQSFDTIDRPIDDELGRFWNHKLDIYSIYPCPVIERSVPSTLLDERARISRAKKTLKIDRLLDRSVNFGQKHFSNLLFKLKNLNSRIA